MPVQTKEQPVIIYLLQCFDKQTLLIVTPKKIGASGFALSKVPVVFMGVMV